MTSVFRTAGAWGAGLGRPLTWVEQDNNTYDKETRITAIEAAGVGVGIDYITVSGDQMTIHMTDHSIQGPFTLPSAQAWNPVGEWQPSSVYQTNDVVTHLGSGYLVNADHTSATSFDPDELFGTVLLYTPLWTVAAPQGQNIDDATFTPQIEDAGIYTRLTNAGGCTVTIDPTVEFLDWTELHFRDESASGGVLFVATSPATFNLPDGFLAQTAGTGATVTLKKVADTNEWDVMGRLATS